MKKFHMPPKDTLNLICYIFPDKMQNFEHTSDRKSRYFPVMFLMYIVPTITNILLYENNTFSVKKNKLL